MKKIRISDINPNDLADAFEHAESYNEQELNSLDFEYEYYAKYPIKKLYQFDDIDAWVEWQPGELINDADARREIGTFRDEAPKWIKNKKIPLSSPIIVVNSKEGTVIGDGRGRVSVSIGMGWKTIPTIIAKQTKSKKIDGSLVVVDIQPEYMDNIYFDMYQFCDYLNENYGKRPIGILYNGDMTVGEVSEDELKFWYMEHGFKYAYEVDYYDKGYGFFRYCMDSSADSEDLVRLIKFMQERNIIDSRQLAGKDWDDFVSIFKNESVEYIREILERSEDLINIPDLMDWLSNWTKDNSGPIELCGGAAEQCLAEVEIALQANDQNYNVNYDWIYG